jgi:hypothetical protein
MRDTPACILRSDSITATHTAGSTARKTLCSRLMIVLSGCLVTRHTMIVRTPLNMVIGTCTNTLQNSNVHAQSLVNLQGSLRHVPMLHWMSLPIFIQAHTFVNASMTMAPTIIPEPGMIVSC